MLGNLKINNANRNVEKLLPTSLHAAGTFAAVGSTDGPATGRGASSLHRAETKARVGVGSSVVQAAPHGDSLVNECMSQLDDAPPMAISWVNVCPPGVYDEEHSIFQQDITRRGVGLVAVGSGTPSLARAGL